LRKPAAERFCQTAPGQYGNKTGYKIKKPAWASSVEEKTAGRKEKPRQR
jgi:hypothetical protein